MLGKGDRAVKFGRSVVGAKHLASSATDEPFADQLQVRLAQRNPTFCRAYGP